MHFFGLFVFVNVYNDYITHSFAKFALKIVETGNYSKLT